jgi:uncharacterized DUF497 family protein
MQFEWDENKRKKNIQKHGIDFVRASKLFESRKLVSSTFKNGEKRFCSVTFDSEINIYIAIIYTERNNKIRIISARRARKNEKEEHKKSLS